MDYRFNKTLLVILSLSSLLLSSNAVPSTRVIDFISTSVSAAAPKSSAIDFTSTSFPAKAPSSIDFISTSVPAKAPSSIDFISTSVPTKAPSITDFISKVVTKVDPEITNICDEGGEKTIYCIATLSKLFQGPFDIVKALEIEVNATLGLAKTLYNTMMKFRNDTSTDKRAIDALDICLDQYGSMLDSINQALECIPQQNFADPYNYMSSVISYKSTCMDAWDESPGVVKPWNEEALTQSTVICIDILYYIVNHHKF